MVIQVVKAKTPQVWYSKYIGEEFNVEDNGKFYQRTDDTNLCFYKEDCVILEEEVDEVE